MEDSENSYWKKEIATVKKLKTKETFPPTIKSIQHIEKSYHNKNHQPLFKYNKRSKKLYIEASLDMHGLTQNQAFEELQNFIKNSYLQDKRTLLIITGKSGVLKEEISRWLSLEPITSIILSYKEAKIKDGGSGAIYIFLKKYHDL